jgi:hypothetical protein
VAVVCFRPGLAFRWKDTVNFGPSPEIGTNLIFCDSEAKMLTTSVGHFVGNLFQHSVSPPIKMFKIVIRCHEISKQFGSQR